MPSSYPLNRLEGLSKNIILLFSLENKGKYYGKIPWENPMGKLINFDHIKKREYYKSSYPRIACPQAIHFYPQQKNLYIDTWIPYNQVCHSMSP